MAQLFPTNFHFNQLPFSTIFPGQRYLPNHHLAANFVAPFPEVAKEKPSEKTHGQGLRNFPATWILEDEVPPSTALLAAISCPAGCPAGRGR